MPSGCNVCNSRIKKLSLFCLWFSFQLRLWSMIKKKMIIQRVPRRQKVLTHGQERLFRKVTSVSIHSFVEWLDIFSYVLRSAAVTVQEVNHMARIFFPEFSIRLYDKNSESDYIFFSSTKIRIFFSAILGIRIFFRKKP